MKYFCSETKFYRHYSLPYNEKIAILKIYNGSGNYLNQYELSNINSSFDCNCLNLLSGVYFYTFETISSIKRGKFVVAR